MRAPTIAELVRAAAKAGAKVYLRGGRTMVEDVSKVPADVMSALRARRDEVWSFLGGADLDRPPLDLMTASFPDIQIVVPRTEQEALAVIAQVEAEADVHAVPDHADTTKTVNADSPGNAVPTRARPGNAVPTRARPGNAVPTHARPGNAVPTRARPGMGLVGFDIETAANAGEEVHQSVTITKTGTVTRNPSLDPEAVRRWRKPVSSAALDPRRSSIRLAQLYGGGSTCMVLDTHLVPITVLAPVLGRRKLVIHNAAFELAFLHHAGAGGPGLGLGVDIENIKFECTLQAAGLCIGVHRRGLDDAALHYLGITVPKELQTSDWSAPVLSAGQIAYAALDAIIALKLHFLLRAELIKKNRVGAYDIQRACIRPVVRMQARGLLLDKQAHQAEYGKWTATCSGKQREYVALTGNEPPATPAQKRALLYAKVASEILKTWPRTEKKAELSTATDRLTRVAAAIPEIALVVEIEKQKKLLGTFGEEMGKRAGTDGRLHASLNVAAAKSGRMSCSDPNLQQMPKSKGMRNCFVTTNGHVLIVADYNMMELRGAAEVANDAVLRSDIAKGLDLHRQTASVVYGVPYDQVTVEQRNGAKAVNFSIVYGASGARIAAAVWADYGIVITPKQGQAARDRYLLRYRGLARWMRTNADLCNHRGYIAIGIGGRIVAAEWETAASASKSSTGDDADVGDGDDADVSGGDGDDANVGDDTCHKNADSYPASIVLPHPSQIPYPSHLRFPLCCNLPVQGACADITMLAIVIADHLFRINNIEGGLVLAVHDELVAEVREEHAAKAAELLEQAMRAAFARVFPNAPVNGLVKVMIVRKWGEAKG